MPPKHRSSLLLVIFLCLLPSLTQATDEYEIETPPSSLAGDTLIVSYGEEDITLADFWARLRFERWLYWRTLEKLVSDQGESVLDLSSTANPYRNSLLNLLNFLGDEKGFADFVRQRLEQEAIHRKLARQRNLSVQPCDTLSAWAELLEWPNLMGCEDSEAFASLREKFTREAIHFTGITEAALQKSITAQVLFANLRTAIREELPPIYEQPFVRARQIRTLDHETSNVVRAELSTGANFTETMLHYGVDRNTYGDSGDLGFLTRGLIVEELDQALFSAEVGTLIGPIESHLGFHIARVLETAPQLQLRHILLHDLAKAESLREDLLVGADFSTLAMEYSLDTVSAKQGGIIPPLTRGQFNPELEDVIFSAKMGELLGPLVSSLGYHLIEVSGIRPRNRLAQASQIVVASQVEADALKRQLVDGADFASLVRAHSTDEKTRRVAGSLGYFHPDSQRLPKEVVDAVFQGSVDEILGPFPVETGFALIRIDDIRDEPFSLRAQHILLESESQAEMTRERIQLGEEFSALAREISLDPSARGQDGDTLAFFSQGKRSGSFLPGDTHPLLEAAVADAEVGEIVGPIETEMGYFILQIEERSTKILNPLEMEEALDAAVNLWLSDQLDTQIRNRNDIWGVYLPWQPMPSDVSPTLAALDATLARSDSDNEEIP